MDSLLVQTQGVGVPLFDAGDLGQNQRVLVGESRWVVFGPLAQLFPVRPQEFAPRLLVIGRRGLIERRHRQRGVKEVVQRRNLAGQGLKQRLRLAGGFQRLGVIA